eukprot:TRINITY_DN2577_c0_g1_i2.p1 TRINITY_DN2577_c0_g1~~TRINITY_DN2577_c0_g1_i2.p1  ORF type:complete len:317 (+),score=76.72 TRINITY_DN2577_c0_g1_i2:272-1222(+)
MTMGIVSMTSRSKNVKILLAARKLRGTNSQPEPQHEIQEALDQGFVPDVSSEAAATVVASTPWFRRQTQGWFSGKPPSHTDVVQAVSAIEQQEVQWFKRSAAQETQASQLQAQEEEKSTRLKMEEQRRARRIESRKLMRERLEFLGLTTCSMKGDGNCMFRALSHQMYGIQDYHLELRRITCDHILANRDRYECFVDERLEIYVNRMKKARTWGDQVALQAAVDVLGVRVHVVNSYAESWHVVHSPDSECSKHRVLPKDLDRERVLFISYLAPEHYDSVVTQRFKDKLMMDDSYDTVSPGSTTSSGGEPIHRRETI